MGSLEESSPYCHGVRVSTVVFEVARSVLVPVVVGSTLCCLLRHYWIINERNADPEWTTIMFATRASPFTAFECSIINLVVELFWISDFCCINTDTVIVLSLISVSCATIFSSALCSCWVVLMIAHM